MEIQVQRSQFGTMADRLRLQHGKCIAEVTLPYWHQTWDEWRDATISLADHYPDTAEEVQEFGEFCVEVARIAKVLDASVADEAKEHKERAAKAAAERLAKEEQHRQEVQERCQQLGQFYAQVVRVQRDGHKSSATGELEVTMRTPEDADAYIEPRMYLKEKDGNRWDFRADAVARFEVKEGGRFKPIKLTTIKE